VFVVNQVRPDTKDFDEHKIVLGSDSEDEAKSLYLSNYSEGWQGLGSMKALDIDELKAWIKTGDTTVEKLAKVGDTLTVEPIDRERPEIKTARANIEKLMQEIFKAGKAAAVKMYHGLSKADDPDDLEKYNAYHGPDGRFTPGGTATFVSITNAKAVARMKAEYETKQAGAAKDHVTATGDKVKSAEAEYDKAKAAYQGLKDKAAAYNRGMNEGKEGYSPHSTALREAQGKVDRAGERLVEAKVAHSQAKTNAEWTKEVTQSRREAWNSHMKSLAGTKITGKKLGEIETKHGFDFQTLKEQISRHGLK
jgi:hypothetical protein